MYGAMGTLDLIDLQTGKSILGEKRNGEIELVLGACEDRFVKLMDLLNTMDIDWP